MEKDGAKPFVPVKWTAELETGFPDVDAQHHTLVGLLNKAGAALNASKPALLEHLLHELIAYSQYHFETEETLMRRYRYAENAPFEAATHLNQHRSFTTRVHVMYDTLIEDGELQPRELLDFLSNWLALHIRHTDQLLVHFVAQLPGWDRE